LSARKLLPQVQQKPRDGLVGGLNSLPRQKSSYIDIFFLDRQSRNAVAKWEDWQHAEQSVQKSIEGQDRKGK
jgi:hypothetical protein